MKIRYCTPFSTSKNLAEAYNHEMELGGAEYICFIDRDTIILDPYYGHKIEKIVSSHPGNYFTCLTNHTNCAWQKREGNHGDDIRQHIQYAQLCWSVNEYKVEDHTHSQLWSGHMMICPVAKWKPLEKKGMLGIDNEIHLNAQKDSKVLLMKGIYIYHWYSGHDGGQKNRDKTHLL